MLNNNRYIEAIELQKELANSVIKENIFDKIELIAGVDVSNMPHDPEGILFSAVVILTYPELKVIEKQHASRKTDFPYIPGLLGFRESPVIIESLEKIINKPDLLIVDGHGISHPRQLGIASHIGVLTGYPSIGCAKSVLVGKPQSDLPAIKGSYVPLIYKKEIVGNVLRSRDNVAPVYVSIGHKVDLETATRIILNSTTKYKHPEPIREAHNYSNLIRKQL